MINDESSDKPIEKTTSLVVAEDARTVLNPGSLDISEAKLLSTSLVDESANHLLGLMKSLEEPNEQSSVMAACEVVKQISSLMRLKLDVYKALKGK